MFKRIITNALTFETSFGNENEVKRKLWIQQQLKSIPSGSRILDAGAGELANKHFCSHLSYTSQDLAQYDGTGNKAGLQTKTWDTSKIDIISDIANIPVPDASFDAILCTEVLEHLPDPAIVFQEFKRLLKPGGILLITAPFMSLTHFAPYHYQSGFNKYYYEYHLQRNKFHGIETTINGNFFEVLAQEIRRIPDVCKTYLNCKPTFWFSLLCNWQIKYLEKIASNDHKSSELLSFGICVRAIND